MSKQTITTSVEDEVSVASFPELASGTDTGNPREMAVLGNVPLEVTVELGRVQMKVRDVLSLQEGTVVDLDRPAGAVVDIVVNGALVARGDVVVVDDELGVRITEIVERP